MKETPEDLYSFGSATSPKLPRQGIDVFPDAHGTIHPEAPPLPRGASTFVDVDKAPLTGHYYRLPKGTILPEGLEVIADGSDVQARSTHEPTHHTIYPTSTMTEQQFTSLFLNLPWTRAGKKK